MFTFLLYQPVTFDALPMESRVLRDGVPVVLVVPELVLRERDWSGLLSIELRRRPGLVGATIRLARRWASMFDSLNEPGVKEGMNGR